MLSSSCNVPNLAGSWSLDLSAHQRDPCELTFGFRGLRYGFAIFGLTILSKSLLASFYFGQGSSDKSGHLSFCLWAMDELLRRTHTYCNYIET